MAQKPGEQNVFPKNHRSPELILPAPASLRIVCENWCSHSRADAEVLMEQMPYVLMGYSSRGVTAANLLWTTALIRKDNTEAEAKRVSCQGMS